MNAAAAALAICIAIPAAASAASAEYRQDARPADLARLARLDQAWREALSHASPQQLRGLGAVVRPDAALVRPEPTPGAYRCRTLKLGLKGAAPSSGLITYGWFRCRVELTPGGDLILSKTTGSQRPMGHLYPDTRRRQVYLGAVAWGDEGPVRYGDNDERDQIGVFERIGAQRYRLVLPYPKQESTLDILELAR
ncbi:DUF4893 domain-containing protein [Phenylobacterium deserti]|uniref:DUF4893 domain-containing protein n=1 Tax=Phenylobacterium deserti TaxID=1914756 RepID=A0A328AQ16_9CAUL|nr:DUF4893 domain-containing protein [Phenylobacterium deserti]RAK56687.1 DUF4893 domain-containing protein [Phenylobacterium deserti]